MFTGHKYVQISTCPAHHIVWTQNNAFPFELFDILLHLNRC